MALKFTDRIRKAWNAFLVRDPTTGVTGSIQNGSNSIGYGSYLRPDRPYLSRGNDRTIVTAIFNRIATDVAAVKVHHCKVDSNGKFVEELDTDLNKCLNFSANIDQTGRELIKDIVLTTIDEGVAAVVPVDTLTDPTGKSDAYEIQSLRVGRITQWYPYHVKIHLYNELTGEYEDIIIAKKAVAIITNPLYNVVNEPNSIAKRLIHALNIADTIDENNANDKLNLIIQLPYTIRSEERHEQARQRTKEVEMQLADSKYGVAYADATEKITQLNRSIDSNIMSKVEYYTSMLMSQLGMTQKVLDGTASEEEQLNYYNSTIEPFLSAITDEMKRKFLTSTAITQGQSISFFKDPFKLTPAAQIAELADKFTRNEILSSNELRAIIGFKPVNNPAADELRNKNLNQQGDEITPPASTRDGTEEEPEESSQFQTRASDILSSQEIDDLLRALNNGEFQ